MQSNLTHRQLAARIAELQGVQKRNPMQSLVWQDASELLAPLFDEMAKRQAANGGEPDYTKWSV